ncbi:MAG: hypothetical protein IPM82_11530 [Saprospiraceae bacterium]|nr:hypothetical protein [Saprospiraceae bacterium]
MKSTIKNFLFSAAVLLLTCSFVGSPVSHVERTPKPTLKSAPVGGIYVVFAGKFGGNVSKKEIASQRELKVEGCDIANAARIFQYTLVTTKNGKTSSLQSKSNALTQEMITQLKSLAPGDEFEFKQIKAYLSNGKDVVDVHAKKYVVV